MASYNALAEGPSTAGTSTKEPGLHAYYEIAQMILDGATRTYDKERECPYIVTSAGEWIGYDDKDSLLAKVAFAKKRKLIGTMVWSLDLDDFDGKYSGGKPFPLIRLMTEEMRK